MHAFPPFRVVVVGFLRTTLYRAYCRLEGLIDRIDVVDEPDPQTEALRRAQDEHDRQRSISDEVSRHRVMAAVRARVSETKIPENYVPPVIVERLDRGWDRAFERMYPGNGGLS